MGFNTKIESVIGRRIPVPQSWREVEQSHANRGVMVGGGSEAGAAAPSADEAQYKSMAKKAADAGGGGGFVAMECKPAFIFGHVFGLLSGSLLSHRPSQIFVTCRFFFYHFLGNENGESYVLQDDSKPSSSDPDDPRKLPEGAGKWDKFKWIVSYPIHTLCIFTIPGDD